jgi:hypothetical protein
MSDEKEEREKLLFVYYQIHLYIELFELLNNNRNKQTKKNKKKKKAFLNKYICIGFIVKLNIYYY